MKKETWLTVARVVLGLWALSAAGHIFLGLFDGYERASGRSDVHLYGGLVQLVISLGLLAILKRE